MCGIIGYSGQQSAVPILLSGLHALEYRGYDSSGISVFDEKEIKTVKKQGRIKNIEEELRNKFPKINTNCGIGHTRWATHGKPSDVNSHPHCTDNVALVHNGIIENYSSLKTETENCGYSYLSETDTEAAAILIDKEYKESTDPLHSIISATAKFIGSYALGILFRCHPGIVYAVKKGSPLIVAVCEHGSFIASDLPAILKYTHTYYKMDDNEIAVLKGRNVEFYNMHGERIEKKLLHTDLTYEQATKAGYPHFMLKEIHEEPEAITKTLSGRIDGNFPNPALSNVIIEKLKAGGRIHISACGTAMHAGLLGKYYIEKYAGIPVNIDIASEFRYKKPIMEKNDVFIALSQSGETADTLAALRLAKESGVYTISVVNAAGSTISDESDEVIYTYAGPEIAVASTKAYTVQAVIMYILAARLSLDVGKITEIECASMIKSLSCDAPRAISAVLDSVEDIKSACKSLEGCDNLFFLGRGIDYYLACEASLKLKEISYIHCEAYAAGELKHGTISLITDSSRVIAIITEKDLYLKTLNNIKEVKSRGANVIIICDETLSITPDVYDTIIRVPHIDNNLTALSCSTAFQLLAYYTSVMRGCDVDKPRNLAKSVTVE